MSCSSEKQRGVFPAERMVLDSHNKSRTSPERCFHGSKIPDFFSSSFLPLQRIEENGEMCEMAKVVLGSRTM